MSLETFGINSISPSTNNKPSCISDGNDKHIIEALYYVSTPKGLKCQLCPNNCIIKIGEEGDCHTRINNEDLLECIAFGNPCAMHIDPIEKKPLYHFLPGSKTYSIATAGCNLACLNCQNWEISQTSPQKTRNYDLMPEMVVRKAMEANCRSIAYTYSDPVVFYEYTLATSKIAKQAILQAGAKKKKRQDKALVDKVSAVIILQSFLSSNESMI